MAAGPLTCGFGYLAERIGGRAARNPARYHNIAAHPGQIKIEPHGAERDQAWRQITAAALPSGPASARPTANCRSSAPHQPQR